MKFLWYITYNLLPILRSSEKNNYNHFDIKGFSNWEIQFHFFTNLKKLIYSKPVAEVFFYKGVSPQKETSLPIT